MKYLIWDFDGTLARRRGDWSGALLEVLEDAGFDSTREVLRPYLQSGFPWHTPDVVRHAGEPSDAWWQRLEHVFCSAFERAVPVPNAQARELARRVRQVFIAARHWELCDGADKLLNVLSRHGWRHVILSNHVPELDDLVAGLGLDRHVEAVVCSAIIGYEKPHPEAFAAALRLRRNGEAVWMVGDNPEADVLGAERAGLRAVLVRRNGVGLAEAAEEILSS